jgi:hypothetical protein
MPTPVQPNTPDTRQFEAEKPMDVVDDSITDIAPGGNANDQATNH